MAIKKYIGARYAPKFMGAWDKASEYAALSLSPAKSVISRQCFFLWGTGIDKIFSIKFCCL